MSRTAEIARKTKETDITVRIDLDGNGTYDIDTGIGFFDHMLSALSKHSGIDMAIKCRGDLEVDTHHSVEDVGIVLGQAVEKALGDKVKEVKLSKTLSGENPSCIVVDENDPSYQMIQMMKAMGQPGPDLKPILEVNGDHPIVARLKDCDDEATIADVFDALVSKRCYKESFSYDKAFEIISESAGSHFDPSLTKQFIQCRDKLEDLYLRM